MIPKHNHTTGPESALYKQTTSIVQVQYYMKIREIVASISSGIGLLIDPEGNHA